MPKDTFHVGRASQTQTVFKGAICPMLTPVEATICSLGEFYNSTENWDLEMGPEVVALLATLTPQELSDTIVPSGCLNRLELYEPMMPVSAAALLGVDKMYKCASRVFGQIAWLISRFEETRNDPELKHLLVNEDGRVNLFFLDSGEFVLPLALALYEWRGRPVYHLEVIPLYSQALAGTRIFWFQE